MHAGSFKVRKRQQNNMKIPPPPPYKRSVKLIVSGFKDMNIIK